MIKRIFTAFLLALLVILPFNHFTEAGFIDDLSLAPPKEKARLKGKEISKLGSVNRIRVQFSGADYDIEIVNLSTNEKGVDILARAWAPDGKQIGFGEDGSVDLERFRIFNPPVLVSDPAGSIVRSYVDNITGETKYLRYRFDTKAAILQSIAHIIKVKQQKDTAGNIVPGKVGKTTTTVYPDADVETNTVDGWVFDNTTNQIWADKRAAAGDSFGDSGAFNNTPLLQRNGADDYSNLWRSVFLFDTDAIGTDSISAATLSLYGSNFNATLGGDITIVLSNPTSNTALATADYEITAHWTMTQQNTTDIAVASWANAYNDFALNATGIGNINKTGITKFGAVTSWDRTNTAPGAGVGYDYVGTQYADTTGTSQDPKLVIEHTASSYSHKANGITASATTRVNGVVLTSTSRVNGL